MPTNISWATETWSPVIGCTKIGAGCQNCYAVGWAHRHANNPRFGTHFQGYNPNPYMGLATPDGKNWTNEVRCLDERLEIPLKWKKPRRIFLSSMGDVFHKDVPDEFLHKLFAVMSFCPQHQFMILTKRAERMREYLSRITTHQAVLFETERWIHEPIEQWPLPNVALGISASNQAEADVAIPELLQTPAAMRFVSCEPLLNSIDLSPYLKGDIHESSRNRIFGTGSNQDVHNRQARQNLETQGMDAGEPHGFIASTEKSDIAQARGRKQFGFEERPPDKISQSDVCGEKEALERPRSPDSLDGISGSAHSIRSRNKSQEREWDGQPPGEFGDCNEITKRDPCDKCAGSEKENPVGDEKSNGKINERASDGNQEISGNEIHASTDNRGNVPSGPANNIEHSQKENMETPGIDLIIAGGETGPGARSMHPDWPRAVRDQCAEAGVPFHFKQWGEWHIIPTTNNVKVVHIHKSGETTRFAPWPCSEETEQGYATMYRAGKKLAGRLLDGVEHNGMMDHTKKWDEQ